MWAPEVGTKLTTCMDMMIIWWFWKAASHKLCIMKYQQDLLGAMALCEVRRHHGIWQDEICNLLYSLK